MPAVWFRLRAELRTRWRSWLGLAVVLGIAGGAVVTLAAGARRTETAYSRFVRAQDAYDAVVLPFYGSQPTNTAPDATSEPAALDAEEIRNLPNVADVAEAGLFYAFVGSGVGVLIPSDGRLGTDVNRFRMLEGRRPDPTNPAEVVVSFTLAEQFGFDVGETVPLFDPTWRDEPPPFVPPEVAARASEMGDRILEALPGGNATIVGIEASPGEFPPQVEGPGRVLIHTSPALAPLAADLAAFSGGGDAFVVRVDGGMQELDAFLTDVRGLGAPVDLVDQRERSASTNRSMHTQGDALWLLALLTAFAGALIGSQLLARFSALESTEHASLAALGVTRAQLFALGVARVAVIGLGAAGIAMVPALALSGFFPTGLARTAELNPGLNVDAAALVLGALALGCLVVVLSLWPVWQAARQLPAGGAASTPSRPTWVTRAVARRGFPLTAGAGLRMALEPGRGRATVPVRSSLAGVALGVITLVAALTFGASLGHLLSTPHLYGKAWDVELTTYDETIVTEGAPILSADDRVDGLAIGTSRAAFVVDGRRVDGLVLDAVVGNLSPSILEGRAPRAADEVVLGTRTMRALGADVGDTLDVGSFASDRPPVPMRVVGRAVFPVFSEVGRLGDGILVTVVGGERVVGNSRSVRDGVLVRLAPGADVEEVVADLEEQMGSGPAVIGQGRPTDIVNFGRVDGTPYLLGAVLAAIGVAALAHLIVSSIRRRRRELAILKALGFVRGQVRSTVAWQATIFVSVALVTGVPIGVAAGRSIWTLFAESLGVVAEPRVPVAALALTVVAALLVANLIAYLPGRAAGRIPAAVVLRSE